MKRLSHDSLLFDLVRHNESLWPFLYWSGVRTVPEGLSVRDCCKEKGLNEDYLLKLLAVCLDDKTVRTETLSSYSMLQLTELCRLAYPFFLERVEELAPVLKDLVGTHSIIADSENASDVKASGANATGVATIETLLASYRQTLITHFDRLQAIVLPHATLVYELYYSPAFTSERPDLLNYSVEFLQSARPEMDAGYGKIIDCLNPLLETGRLTMQEVRSVHDFDRLHRAWQMQDKIEQQLFKSLVLQMEDSIISTLQKKKKSFVRNNFVPMEQDAVADLLTSREKEVLTLVALGFMNKEMADRLGIGLTTVITHRKKLMEKLSIKTVSGLTVYAHTHGFISTSILTNED